MKNTKIIIVLLVLSLLFAVVPTDIDAKVYEDTLRLHILARSDSEEDQAIKIYVRDKLLQKYGILFSDSASKVEATKLAKEKLETIKEDVELWLTEINCEQSVEIVIGEEWYDTREYNGFILPKGIYTSLRIMLDGGNGKNWWCVLYPPLCTEIASERAPADDAFSGYTDEVEFLVKNGRYNIKFKLLEIISEAFGQNS